MKWPKANEYTKYLGHGFKEDHILFSKVLPTGYVNSVSLAQHLHRQVICRAFEKRLSAGQEIRRDLEFPDSELWFRVYLDNFDLLSVRSQGIVSAEHDSLLGVLRDAYKQLGIPRNEKKAVEAAHAAEMQGAWIDGNLGICSPKPDKVGKYLSCLGFLLKTRKATRKQLQMVAGGMIFYVFFQTAAHGYLEWCLVSDHQLQNGWSSQDIAESCSEGTMGGCFLVSLFLHGFQAAGGPGGHRFRCFWIRGRLGSQPGFNWSRLPSKSGRNPWKPIWGVPESRSPGNQPLRWFGLFAAGVGRIRSSFGRVLSSRKEWGSS